MVMLKSLFLAGLVLTSAFAQEIAKPTMATLHVQPNFDFSLTSKEFRVHYSGLGSAFASTKDDAIIKIYEKGSAQAVISYTVDSAQKNEKKAYYFALRNAADGEYEVEVCAGATTCSGKTPALTSLKQSEQHELTCEEGTKAADGTWNKQGDFKLNFVGPEDSDWIAASEFDTIESTLNRVLQAAGSTTTYKTNYNKHSLTKNPVYKKVEKVLYVGIKYNVAQYRQLFDKKKGDDDHRPKYSHDFCKRKYLLSAHVHLVNKNTNEVKYRFKTTLHLSGAAKQYYILDENAATRKVPVEMIHKNADIVDGTYKVHVTFCATEKDAIDSTVCADPIVHTDDMVVE